MSEKNIRFNGRLSLLAVGVFLVFLFLKLSEIGVVASWSWWWVTAPLWGYACLIVALLLLWFLVLFVTTLLSGR